MFLDNFGDYEIVCNAKKNVFDKEQEIRFVIEANSSNEANSMAEKRLKNSGYKIFEIKSVKQVKSKRKVNNVIYATNSKDDANSDKKAPQRKILIIMGLIAFIFLVVIFVLVGTGVIG